MAAKKEIKAKVKVMCPGGQATPAPPVGPTLGQHGLSPGEFVKRFNDMTKNQPGVLIPAIITIYSDRSFDIEIKTPPASFLLKQAAGIIKGSPKSSTEKVGQVSRTVIQQIAKTKMKDLNTVDLAAAVRMVEGTAKNMGIRVVD
jgi:large subunit ribosomal protein L11